MRILAIDMEEVITQPDTLKDKIIRRIDDLSPEKLKELDQYIDQLENHKNSKQKILSFSGGWRDLDEEVFLSLTEILHDNRKKGSKRIL
ncbi:MAG: hypothetical protein RIG62_23685 [Cyclobacteriaceae bacterium]